MKPVGCLFALSALIMAGLGVAVAAFVKDSTDLALVAIALVGAGFIVMLAWIQLLVHRENRP